MSTAPTARQQNGLSAELDGRMAPRWPQRRAEPTPPIQTNTYTRTCGAGAPRGNRTPVSTLKGWRPRPLDDGGRWSLEHISVVAGRKAAAAPAGEARTRRGSPALNTRAATAASRGRSRRWGTHARAMVQCTFRSRESVRASPRRRVERTGRRRARPVALSRRDLPMTTDARGRPPTTSSPTRGR